MIGSLMSRMADAEKLSIPQLNEAVKNGTIPAYVGVPLIQEKMKAQQAAQAMVAQTQAQPPIARQVMEQADAMTGLDKLRSNLPEEGFAGGGIVAFADGGEVKGYAAGGKTMLPQFQNLSGSQPTQQGFVNPRGTMSPEMQAYYAQDFANQGIKTASNAALMGTGLQNHIASEQVTSLPQIAVMPPQQPTGQSTFPGATSMQGGFGQGAQGYPSFTMGSGGFGGGGASGAFPLEGRYGIVRMAEGGVTTPDEDEDEEKGLMSRLMAGITSLKSSMPESYEAMLAQRGQTPASARKLMIDGPKKGDYVMPPLDSQRPSGEGIMQRRGGHKYEDLVIREAERIGLDPNMAIHVLYKETGNLKNPETVRSKAGAIGVMQLMPKTAKQLGVDPLNPEENIRGGVMYLKQMMDKYNDPTLAFAAYNAGPGRVDKALKSGQGIAALPRETQNYIRMAGGGIVAFQNRGLVDQKEVDTLGGQLDEARTIVEGLQSFGSKQRQQIPDFDTRLEEAKKRRGELQTQYEQLMGKAGLDKAAFGVPPMGVSGRPREADPVVQQLLTSPGTATVAQPPAAPAVPTVKTSTDEDSGPYIGGQAPAAAPAAPEPYKEPPPDSGLSDIKNLLKQRMEESGKQKRIDAYLSLLQAGLGMMGGTSPFAAANIGQGAATGVAAQMAARKAQVAEENAILSGQLGLSRAELYEKMRRDALKQQYEKDIAAQKLGRERLGVQQQALNVRLGDLRRKAIENWDSSPDKAQLEADLAKQKKNWRQDANLLGQYNMMKERFINGIVNVGQADNVLSSSQL